MGKCRLDGRLQLVKVYPRSEGIIGEGGDRFRHHGNRGISLGYDGTPEQKVGEVESLVVIDGGSEILPVETFPAGRVVKPYITAGEFHELYAGGYKAFGQLGKLVKGELGYIIMSMSRN